MLHALPADNKIIHPFEGRGEFYDVWYSMSRKNMTTVSCLQFVIGGDMNIFTGDDSCFMDIVADNFQIDSFIRKGENCHGVRKEK